MRIDDDASDSELLQRWRDGDDGAERKLTKRYDRVIRAYVRRLAPGDAEFAADVAQEAAAKLFLNLRDGKLTVDVRGSLLTIAKKIAYRTLISAGRGTSLRRTESLDGDPHDGGSHHDDTNFPSAQPRRWPAVSEYTRRQAAGWSLDSGLVEEELARAVECLPSPDREIVELLFIGYKMRDICAVYGIDPSISSAGYKRLGTRVHEIRNKLRDLLAAFEQMTKEVGSEAPEWPVGGVTVPPSI